MLVAALLFGSGAAYWYFHRYQIVVECMLGDDHRKIEVVRYSTRPIPSFFPHTGGPSVHHGVRFRTQSGVKWVLAETWIDWRARKRICERSFVADGLVVIFPVVVYHADRELPWYVSEYSVGPRGLLVLHDGKWKFQGAYLQNEGSPHSLGDIALTPWTTTSVSVDGVRLVATQSAISKNESDVLLSRTGLPNHPYSMEEQYAFGEELDSGSFPELRPLVERRLVSGDFGRTWKVLDWKVLRLKAVPKGAELKLMPQPVAL